jgi:hypothetical protein
MFLLCFRLAVLYQYCTNAYCCVRYSFECIQVVNFNVSSIKLMQMLNFLDTFSMGVIEILLFVDEML